MGCPLKLSENGESAKATETSADEERPPESSKEGEERTSSFGPWIVAQRNRRRPAANPRRISGSTGDIPAGDEDIQARSMERGAIVNGDRGKSRKTAGQDQVVNGAQQSQRETTTKQSVGRKERFKTSLAAGMGSFNGQTGKQTSNSSKSVGNLNSKRSGASGSRFSVLSDQVNPQKSRESEDAQQEQEGTAEMDTQE